MFRLYAPLSSLLIFTTATLWAFQQPSLEPLPNFDRREGVGAATADQRAAADTLRERVPHAIVEFDSTVGAPKSVRSQAGFLTGPNGSGGGVSATIAAGIGANESHRALKGFLTENAALFGHDAKALGTAAVKRDFTTAHNGMRTVVWQQQVD